MLRSPGIPISNWTDKPGYINKSEHLDSGDSIFYYTDGIMELRNEKGEQYDEDKLLGILLGGGGDSKALLEAIMRMRKVLPANIKSAGVMILPWQ